MKKTITVMTMVIALAMSTMAMAIASSSIGNEAIERTTVDLRSDFTIVDTNNPADATGTISEVEFYAHEAGTLRFVIVDSDNEVTAVSDAFTTESVGVLTAPFEAGVTEGDNLAVYSQGAGVVSFAFDGDPAEYTSANDGLPEVGETLVIQGTSARTYSMNATITPEPDAKDACKNGGWEGFYRNQGQCVSEFARNK